MWWTGVERDPATCVVDRRLRTTVTCTRQDDRALEACSTRARQRSSTIQLCMSEREKPLRVAVVGCGAVAERYHLPALVASPDVEVTALVDPSVERARALARRANTAHTFSTHRELAGHVDLAVVAVPNALHESIACDLLA